MTKLPTIVNSLQITTNANKVQLWTVIPYAVATPTTGAFVHHNP